MGAAVSRSAGISVREVATAMTFNVRLSTFERSWLHPFEFSAALAVGLPSRPICPIKYSVAAIAITESCTCVHRAKGPISGSI